jgi:hypothetical protein
MRFAICQNLQGAMVTVDWSADLAERVWCNYVEFTGRDAGETWGIGYFAAMDVRCRVTCAALL